MLNNLPFFFYPFFVSLVVTFVLLLLIIFAFKSKHLKETRNSARHSHCEGITRFGGVAVILGFVAAVILDGRLQIDSRLLVVIFSTLFILLFGLLDDIYELSWKKQLFFQVILVSAVYYFGIRLEYVTNPFGGLFFFEGNYAWLGFLFAGGWIIFLMNSMNWLDGVDGVSGVVTLIAVITIFFLSLKPEVNQPPIGIVTASIAGAIFSFLLLNFHPAKIMAGSSGSMFMGFILAILAIFAGAKIATTLMVLALPVIDALWVTGERLYRKRSIFEADKLHLHYRLMEVGWSVRKIFIFYLILTSVVALLALNMKTIGKISSMFAVSFFLIGIIVMIRSRSIASKK